MYHLCELICINYRKWINNMYFMRSAWVCLKMGTPFEPGWFIIFPWKLPSVYTLFRIHPNPWFIGCICFNSMFLYLLHGQNLHFVCKFWGVTYRKKIVGSSPCFMVHPHGFPRLFHGDIMVKYPPMFSHGGPGIGREKRFCSRPQRATCRARPPRGVRQKPWWTPELVVLHVGNVWN